MTASARYEPPRRCSRCATSPGAVAADALDPRPAPAARTRATMPASRCSDPGSRKLAVPQHPPLPVQARRGARVAVGAAPPVTPPSRRTGRRAAVQLVISDAHPGCFAAIGSALPGAAWQHCRTRYRRNLLTRVLKSARPHVVIQVRAIFDQADTDADEPSMTASSTPSSPAATRPSTSKRHRRPAHLHDRAAARPGAGPIRTVLAGTVARQ